MSLIFLLFLDFHHQIHQPCCAQDVLPDQIWPILAQGFAEEPCRWLMSSEPSTQGVKMPWFHRWFHHFHMENWWWTCWWSVIICDYHDTRDFGGQKIGDLRFQDVPTIFEHTFCQVQPTCSSKWWWQSALWIVGRGWNACHSHVAPCLRFRAISLMMSCGQGCSPQHFLQELVMTQDFWLEFH